MTSPTESFDTRLEQILMAYKRYPYGNEVAPHISGADAVEAIRELVLSERIDAVKLLIETVEANGGNVTLDSLRSFQAGQLLAQARINGEKDE